MDDNSKKKLLLAEAEDEEQPLLIRDAESSRQQEDVTTMTLVCFVCIALSAFLGDASRGLVVPSIVPFLYVQGANSAFVGYVNAAYSAARLISAPLFGYWAEKRTFKESVIVNLAIFIVGNFMYAMAGTPLGSPTMILISRFLVGLGSGTLGLARGYVVLTTSKADRTQWMAYLTAAQFIGYSVTPGVGALMSFADIDIIGELVEFDGFTGGGYLMVMFGAVNLVMMFVFFTEPAKPAAKEIVYDVNSPEPERKSFVKRAFVYFTSWVGVGVLLYATLQLMSRNAIAVYETLSQLIAVNNFGWGIFVLGMVSCAFGIVGTIVLFMLKPLSKYISDEHVLFVGLFAIGVGYTIFTPWGGVGEAQGVLIAQYCIGSVFIFGIGFPISQALVLSLFSKLLGPMQQSTIMGFMASAGSAARVLGAVVAGWAFETDQMQLCLVLLIVTVFLPSGALWIWHLLYSKRTTHEEIPSGPLELEAIGDIEKPKAQRF